MTSPLNAGMRGSTARHPHRERLAGVAGQGGASRKRVKVGAAVGFPHGACTTAVKIFEAMEAMKNVGSLCRVKASGGIRDLAALRALVDAGAERIGTSAGPAIMEEYRKQK